MMILRDLPEESIERALDLETYARAEQAVWADLGKLVIDLARPAAVGSKFEPLVASKLIENSVSAVEHYVQKITCGYSSTRWLWLLRRLPTYIFEDSLRSTSGYAQLLAEVLTSASTKAEKPVIQAGVVTFGYQGSVIKRLASVCACTRFIAHLHQAFRWAGKGATLRLHSGGILFDEAPGDLRAAVQLYDRRNVNQQHPTTRFGTVIGHTDRNDTRFTIIRLHQIEPIDVELPFDEGEASLRARFFPALYDLTELKTLSADPRLEGEELWDEAVVISLVMLRVAAAYAIRHRLGHIGLFQRGYLLEDGRLICRTVDRMLEEDRDFLDALLGARTPLDGRDFLRRAEQVVGISWPLQAGPLVRRDADVTCLDFAAATARFDAGLVFPRANGAIPNARAEHFETAVQRIVDSTAWRPSNNLAGMRGRTLRRDGEKITDLDAIGATGTTLLAISCKSIADPGDYDKGTYQSVRNAATKVVDAVIYWQRIVSSLSTAPVGDNFDFRQFSKIIGVVCTPQVFFVPAGPATAEVAPGLLSACSANELRSWLNAKPDQSWVVR